jgi:hypothetical protein
MDEMAQEITARHSVAKTICRQLEPRLGKEPPRVLVSGRGLDGAIRMGGCRENKRDCRNAFQWQQFPQVALPVR